MDGAPRCTSEVPKTKVVKAADIACALEAPVERCLARQRRCGQCGKRGHGSDAECKRDPSAGGKRFSDPLHIWARYARANKRGPQAEREIKLGEPDRRAFETLGFRTSAKSDEIKRAYKTLVKIHHPDANGGDKASEERLRSIIAAYTHLKQKGFVGA
mgnify:CR=1 FL=1